VTYEELSRILLFDIVGIWHAEQYKPRLIIGLLANCKHHFG
jgi:hypothetical protein